MSTGVCLSSDQTPACGQFNPAQVSQIASNPLLQLPFDWRLPVWDFWSHFSDLLTAQLALCSRLRHWRERHGLTLGVLQRVMQEMQSPEVSAGYQFATELLADLGRRVTVALCRDTDPELARVRRIQAQRDAAERRENP
jgi:hypothetical protein